MNLVTADKLLHGITGPPPRTSTLSKNSTQERREYFTYIMHSKTS